MITESSVLDPVLEEGKKCMFIPAEYLSIEGLAKVYAYCVHAYGGDNPRTRTVLDDIVAYSKKMETTGELEEKIKELEEKIGEWEEWGDGRP